METITIGGTKQDFIKRMKGFVRRETAAFSVKLDRIMSDSIVHIVGEALQRMDWGDFAIEDLRDDITPKISFTMFKIGSSSNFADNVSREIIDREEQKLIYQGLSPRQATEALKVQWTTAEAIRPVEEVLKDLAGGEQSVYSLRFEFGEE